MVAEMTYNMSSVTLNLSQLMVNVTVVRYEIFFYVIPINCYPDSGLIALHV